MNLVMSALMGDLIGIQEALKSGEDISQCDRDHRTALMHATIAKHDAAVAHLLQSGADPNVQDRNGRTALHFAVQEHVSTITKLLLNHGATVDCRDENGNTPLFNAVFNSRERGEVIAVLLQGGANKDVPNKHGISPAMLAKSIGNYDVQQFLA